MGVNITRGKPIKYYSSERMATQGQWNTYFWTQGLQLSRFFNKMKWFFLKIPMNWIQNYYFINNNNLRKKIAYNGYKKAHRIFNNKIIAEYMVKMTLGEKIKNKQVWHNG